MSHLGDRVSALADGHLDPRERDRALAHVARCDSCRRLVEAERRARGVLADLADPVPSSQLLARLTAIGVPPPPVGAVPPPRPGAVAAASAGTPAGPPTGTSAAAAVSSRDRSPGLAPRRPGDGRPVDRADSRRPDRRRRSRHRGVRAAAAGALAVTAVSLGLAALGSTAAVGPTPVAVVPPVERFAVEHARSTGSLPFVESAVLVVPADEGNGLQ